MDQGTGSRAGPRPPREDLILVDTSAWIEYLRRTQSPVDIGLEGLIEIGGAATTQPVVMEILAGALTESRAIELRDMLAGSCATIPVEGDADYVAAATIYRSCRRAGRTLRNQLDCMIAAVAIRTGMPLLHRDADFDFIARHTALEVYAPG